MTVLNEASISGQKSEFQLVFGFFPNNPNDPIEVTKVKRILGELSRECTKKDGRLRAVLHDRMYSQRQAHVTRVDYESSLGKLNRAVTLASCVGFSITSCMFVK